MMFVLHIFPVLIAAVSLTRGLGVHTEPVRSYPICEKCRDPELMVAPGIGFDLTHSYGAAAIRFQNGSVVFLGKVEGDDAFIRLMIRDSLESSRPKTPQTIPEKLRDAWERAKRLRNKSRGLPATEDVGTVANVLIALRNITELHLGHNITAAVTAIPRLPGLTSEDLEDAMEYAGLKLLRSYDYYDDVREESAAYAGLGNGLCKHPEDIESCEEEKMNMRYYAVLSISFTDFMFSLRMTVCASASQCWDYAFEDDYDLALRFKHWYGEEWRYWAAMRRTIRRFVEVNSVIDKMQPFGEAASNKYFHEALRGALRDLEPREISVIGDSEKLEPLSLVARGAAELAKRFQVMTWNCIEPTMCSDTEMVERPEADL